MCARKLCSLEQGPTQNTVSQRDLVHCLRRQFILRQLEIKRLLKHESALKCWLLHHAVIYEGRNVQQIDKIRFDRVLPQRPVAALREFASQSLPRNVQDNCVSGTVSQGNFANYERHTQLRYKPMRQIKTEFVNPAIVHI